MAKRITPDEFRALAYEQLNTNVLSKPQMKALAAEFDVMLPTEIRKQSERIGRGLYKIGEMPDAPKAPPLPAVEVKTPVQVAVNEVMAMRNEAENFEIPVDKHFIEWGSYDDIKAIIENRNFFPAFITGLSGNGKTTTIEQACARTEQRECIRINFTRETNEDDLLGGFRLVNGDTVFQYGPVAEAYFRGAILILDEIDAADPNKVMVLQAALEGKPIFIKKLGKRITPAKGYNVFATANTKGKGSSDGRFNGTNVLNEAFLDRFAITIEQDYPNSGIETRILTNWAKDYANDALNDADRQIIKNLVAWGQITRESFKEESVDELISTRRLICAIQSYFIFNKDIRKAVKYAVSRFDDEVREAFEELYLQLDGGLKSS